jgi:Methyltransferase domain
VRYGSAVTGDHPRSSAAPVPWQAGLRALAQRLGVDPRYLRRVRWIHKAHAVRQAGGSLRQHLGLVLTAPEPDNFTYEIANDDALAEWVAAAARCDAATATRLVAEPRRDAVLQARLRAATAGHWLWTKRSPPFARRVGWYALARAAKPELIVEVGAHDGLGSLLLLRALQRNADEGGAGRLVSFDINPTAGWLVGADPRWELRIQSSGEGLPAVTAGGTVGMFVYDGWHTYDAERADLEVVADRLAPDGLLVSDDAQVTRALQQLAAERGLDYVEFQERPLHHFHPGVMTACARAPRRP